MCKKSKAQNANQSNSLQEIVLILYPRLTFLAFRAYLLEPPPQDYITKGKPIKNVIKINELILGYALVIWT